MKNMRKLKSSWKGSARPMIKKPFLQTLEPALDLQGIGPSGLGGRRDKRRSWSNRRTGECP
jgi:hypothetical protein